MKNKYIRFGYYFWGLFFSLMVVFGMITGKTPMLLENDRRFAIFIYRTTNPFFYYLWNAIYGFLGVGLLYRSLIFIQSNRDFLKEQEGFDRKIVGLERENEKIDILRVLTVTLSTITIFGFLYYIFLIV
jgi:hypothetical protein